MDDLRVAVISDTHDLLRPEVLAQISLSDVVIHAGDFSSRKIFDQIRAAMPDPSQFYCVRGNNDHGWGEEPPEVCSFAVDGVRFNLIHNVKKLPGDVPAADILVFGHSHKFLAEQREGCFWLNPGSCGKRRFHQEISMAVLEISGGSWTVEKVVIEHGTPSKNAESDTGGYYE